MAEHTFTANGVTVQVTLRQATVGDNMRKAILEANAGSNQFADYAEQVVAYSIFPRCVAAASGVIHWPGHDPEEMDIKDLRAADFIALPGEIGEAWLTEVVRLNPFWDLLPATQAENASAEKKD